MIPGRLPELSQVLVPRPSGRGLGRGVQDKPPVFRPSRLPGVVGAKQVVPGVVSIAPHPVLLPAGEGTFFSRFPCPEPSVRPDCRRNTTTHGQPKAAFVGQQWVLRQLGLDKYPDKTWIGKLGRGFDFLGYRHTRAGCTPARDTHRRLHARLTRLYEQGAPARRIGGYVSRWRRWVCGGLPESIVLVEQIFSPPASPPASPPPGLLSLRLAQR